MLKTIDAILNRFTMYRVVLYGLGTLLAVAEVLALTGTISVSAGGLAVSIAVLAIGSYAANKLFAKLLHAATNTESWLITALILACILPPVTSFERAGYALLAAAIAMASKYILVFRGSHIFNPAALAAFAMSITGLLPATWWIANPSLVPIAAIMALAVLRKQRKFTLFISFGLAAGLMLLFVSSGLHHMELGDVVKGGVESWPIIFMGSIMLTEPTTLPPTRYYQVLLGLLVGAIFSSQLHWGSLATTPQVALLLGNLFVLVCTPPFGAMLRLKELRQLSTDIYEAVFERPARLQFAAGQYLEWTLPHAHTDSRGNRRTFSIASAPTEPDVRIGFRHYERSSSFKTALLALQPGKYIRAAHVAGSFILPHDLSQPLVFIAGGIGITPFRSMVQYLVDTNQQANITLLYFAAREEDFVYKNVFDAASNNGITAHYIVGRPDAETICQVAPNVAKVTTYISGPDALVSGCKGILRGMGVSLTRIRTDHFSGY
jgi:ferredoxin-NADP reductase/Na+-transporting NADH:ubiquinone oxidoreductase subunit NqrB